jgi:hypothetical protein
MRRLLTFAAFLLCLSIVPAFAQRGGGGHGGGFSGGHSAVGGHAGFSGHAAGPAYSGSHYGSYSGSHWGSGPRYYNNGIGVRIRTYPYGYGRGCWGCYGYGYGYGYPYYGYLDPYWWWDTYNAGNDDYANQREQAYAMDQQNLDEQQMLREQDQDSYTRPRAAGPAPARQEEHAQNDPTTVLVFRDQHQREIQNYAIADGILWNFTAARTEKIPLSIIDVPATVKVNEDRGVEFHLPGTGDGA